MIGSFFLLTSTYLFALQYNQELELRILELKRLSAILLHLKSEINYMCNTLPESFRKIAENEFLPFQNWLNRMADQMDLKQSYSFGNIWLSELIVLSRDSHLKECELSLLKELSDKLGNMDLKIQTDALDYVLEGINHKRKKLEEDLFQKKKIVYSLSICGCFVILILLI